MRWTLFRSRPTRQLRAANSHGRLFRPCLEELEERRLLATFNWVVNGDGDFNTATNWRDQNNVPGVPGVADDANISFTDIAVTSFTSNTVNSLACNATLSIASGTFSIADVAKNSSINSLVLAAGTTLQASAGIVFIGGGTSAGTLVALGSSLMDFNGGQLNMNAGSLLTGNGLFFVGGGTLGFNVDTSAPANFQVDSGTIDGPGILTITNNFTWSGGALDGNGTTIVPAGTTLNISGGSAKFLTGGHILELAGTAAWTGTGELDGSPGSTINNGGLFTVLNDAVCGNGAQGAGLIFNNRGTFTKTGNGGTTSFQGNLFNNNGTVNVDSGTLDFSGGGASTGVFNAAAGCSVAFDTGNYVLNSGTALDGAGLYEVVGGGGLTLNVNLDVQNFGQDTGVITEPTATLTVTSTFTWSAGTMTGAGITTIPASATAAITGASAKYLTGNHVLNLTGTTTWTGTGELDGSPGSTVNNSGTFTAQNDAVCGNGAQGAGVIFNNSGIFTKSGSTGTTFFQGNLFNNSGTVHVNSGTLTLNGGGASTGVFDVAAGSTINFDSTNSGGYVLDNGTALNGAGLYRLPNSFDGLTVTVNLTAQNLELDNGTLTEATATLIINNFVWTGGTLTGAGLTAIPAGGVAAIGGPSAKLLTGGHILNLAGTTTWTGVGELDGGPGTIINNSGTFTALNDAVCGNGAQGAGLIFHNSGTFTKNGTVGTTSFQGNVLNNSGVVNVQSGTLRFSNDYTQTAGSTMIGAGAKLTSSGKVDIQAGGLNGLGTVNADVRNAGTVGTGTGTGTLTITGSFIQTAPGVLDIKVGGFSQFDAIAVGGAATLAGTINISLINNYVPTAGLTFKVLTFASASGDFSTTTGLSISPTVSFNPTLDPTDMTLMVIGPESTNAGVLQFSAATYTANVTSGTATITVARGNGSEGAASVDYATLDGSSMAGVSYTATTGTLTFAQGITSQTFRIPLLSGAVGLGNQTVNLIIRLPTGGATLGTQTTAVLTLLDDSQTIVANHVSDDVLFVSGLYHDVLARSADAGGLDSFQQTVDSARNQLLIPFALAYITSAENRANFVASVYAKYLGRTPSSAELGSWVSQMRQGMTAEQVVAAFVASPEYFQKQGSSNGGWLDHAYQDLLGRQPDPGSQGFLTQLNDGLSLNVVATALISSVEYRTRLITQVYATYLLRQPGRADLQAWLPTVGQPPAGPGKPSLDEQFLAAVLGSVEYFQTSGNTEVAWTTSLYTKVLGRNPSQPELTNLLAAVLNSFAAPRQAIAAAIAASAEAETIVVGGYYTQFLGRSGSTAELSGWVNLILHGGSREQVIAGIVSSPEYFQKQGGTNTQFANHLYVDLLGRPLGANDTGFIDALAAGNMTPLQVATTILLSTEYTQRLVNLFYRGTLGRPGTATETDGWVRLLLQGTRDEEVLAMIIASPEYFLRSHAYP